MKPYLWGSVVLALFVLPGWAAAAAPLGVFEGIDSEGTAVGWVVDPDAPSTAIDVHFYMDGAAGAGGTWIGWVKAGDARPDVGYVGDHGFRFSLPPIARDGAPHLYYAYGIDTSRRGSDNLVLDGSPRAARLGPALIRMDNGTIRVGVEPRCGGTIAEVVLNGVNVVNNADCTGRQVQVSLYDGNASYDDCNGCSGTWGWNPVQGGDMYGFGSPLRMYSAGPGGIYIRTQPYEWLPDDKGGGPGSPVLSDVVVEQWMAFVPEEPLAVKVHFKITHVGTDTHGLAIQEFPATYVNLGFDRFVFYNGTSPWTDGAVTSTTISEANLYAPERWGAFVDDQGVGLTVYVPGQYPYISGVRDDSGVGGSFGPGYNYSRPFVPFAFQPGSILEGDVYLIAGDYRAARAFIYRVNSSAPAQDSLPPVGFLDTPRNGQAVTGRILVSGWALDNSAVDRVEIFVDGVSAGLATYGTPRSDVVAVFPHALPESGFSFILDTATRANGQHTIEARAVDSFGNAVQLPDKVVVTINNTFSSTVSKVINNGCRKRRCR